MGTETITHPLIRINQLFKTNLAASEPKMRWMSNGGGGRRGRDGGGGE